MKKIIPLLKYLDRKKITPEALLEIAAVFNWPIQADTAAELANAFRTRGVAGLVPMLPELLALTGSSSQSEEGQPKQIPYQCKHCGELGLIILTDEQFHQL